MEAEEIVNENEADSLYAVYLQMMNQWVHTCPLYVMLFEACLAVFGNVCEISLICRSSLMQ